MIKAIKVINYLGNSVRMDLKEPEKSGFLIKSIDGLGPVKAIVSVNELSLNDGGTFNSARLDKRNIILNLQFYFTGTENIEDVRQKSYKYFPVKKEITFIVETDNRTVQIAGVVESNEPNIFSKEEGCQISIICPDPYFYSMDENVTTFYGIIPEFEFEFENNSYEEPLLEMGEIVTKMENTVYYEGDSEIGITLVIHAIGEASNVTIYNTGTRQSMVIDTDKLKALTGNEIIHGDTITITTVKHNKRVELLREGKTTNILNCIARGSDWFTLTKGDNIFAYVAEKGSSNLQFKIINKVIYEGV